MAQVFSQYRSVQRADGLNIQRRCLLQNRLDLAAVFADDADVIAPGLVCPILCRVLSAKLSEGIRGEQHLVRTVVSHDDLRPVDHGSGNEAESVLAEGQGIAFAHGHLAGCEIHIEKVLNHPKRLGGSHDFCRGIGLQKADEAAGVIRLHVLSDDVIGCSLTQNAFDVVQPDFREMGVHRIDDGNLFIDNHIGIVGHTVGNTILALKQVNCMVVNTDITNILRNHG